MVRRLSLLAGFVLFVCFSAQAQGPGDKVEVFGGYSYMRTDDPSVNLNGWELAGQYKFTDWLGGVADFGGEYGSLFGPSTSIHTFLFGPQVSWPARVSPFAHVLIGAAHADTAGDTQNSFAAAVGGGIDARLVHGIYWRIFQADYLPTHFGGTREDNARISTGVVFRF